MARLSARQIALAALRRWRKQKRFADASISELLAKTELTSSDRAFALELFYGVLRNLTLLDFWIGCLRGSGIDRDLRDILRFGLYQLLCLRTPEHAAVHETVELAAKKQRNVVNAILRTTTRQRSQLLARAAAKPLFVRTSHPQFLVERWQQHFGDEHAEELCKWNNLPAPVYARINLLKSIEQNSSTRTPNRVLCVIVQCLCNSIRYLRPPWNAVIVTFRTPAPRLPASCWIQSLEKGFLMQLLRPVERPATSRNSWKISE